MVKYDKDATIRVLNNLLEQHEKLGTNKEYIEVLSIAINAVECVGYGCSLCLAHNNMKCPRIE